MAASIACQADSMNARRAAVLSVAGRQNAMSRQFIQVTAGGRKTGGKLRSTGGDADMIGRGVNLRPQWSSRSVESLMKLVFQFLLGDSARFYSGCFGSPAALSDSTSFTACITALRAIFEIITITVMHRTKPTNTTTRSWK